MEQNRFSRHIWHVACPHTRAGLSIHFATATFDEVAPPRQQDSFLCPGCGGEVSWWLFQHFGFCASNPSMPVNNYARDALAGLYKKSITVCTTTYRKKVSSGEGRA